jgi:hypothetical protein
VSQSTLEVQLEVDRLRQKALRGETMTLEECKRAVALCRAHRLKTRPALAGAKDPSIPRLSAADILKGLS